MNEKISLSPTVVHHGHNIKRLREILRVKQDGLAVALQITQQAVSPGENRINVSSGHYYIVWVGHESYKIFVY